jgi:5-methylcytosine-specific restriction endonuclease McrA
LAVFSDDCDEALRKHLWHRIQITILRRDRFTCQDCGRDHREVGRKKNGKGMLEVHHIVPRSIGGTDHPGNLKTLCHRCHRRYTDDTISEVRHAKRIEDELRMLCLNEHVILAAEEDASGDMAHLESDR